MKHFDVTYKSPIGIIGTHFAVRAENEAEAAQISPMMLCYGTNYAPEQFKVLKVVNCINEPRETIFRDNLFTRLIGFFRLKKEQWKIAKKNKSWAQDYSPIEIDRKKICSECPRLSRLKFCGECGCYMPLKIRLAALGTQCPLGKW